MFVVIERDNDTAELRAVALFRLRFRAEQRAVAEAREMVADGQHVLTGDDAGSGAVASVHDDGRWLRDFLVLDVG
jgi:hypothetical protein